MFPRRIQDRELALVAVGLCVLAITSCDKEAEKPSNLTTVGEVLSPVRTANVDVIDAAKVWRDHNLSQIDTVNVSPAGVEVRIKARNQLAAQTDIGSFATAASLESSIARGIGKALKSSQITAETARQLSNQISVTPLSPMTLAAALSITLDEAKTKVVSNSSNRYEAFATLFASLPSEPTEAIQRKIASSGTDDWLISGQWPFINLCKIIEARVQLAALQVLVQYAQKGGQLSIATDQFEKELKRLVPESFEGELIPEAGFLRSTHLRPSDVIKLLEGDQ